ATHYEIQNRFRLANYRCGDEHAVQGPGHQSLHDSSSTRSSKCRDGTPRSAQTSQRGRWPRTKSVVLLLASAIIGRCARGKSTCLTQVNEPPKVRSHPRCRRRMISMRFAPPSSTLRLSAAACGSLIWAFCFTCSSLLVRLLTRTCSSKARLDCPL